MKAYIAALLMLALTAFLLFRLDAYRNPEGRFSPVEPAASSQIFIHGTPVCVFRMHGNIVAKVGPCGDAESPGIGAAPREEPPSPENPARNLPPGHPPVTPDMSAEGLRRVPI